jgi:hypothetical protein
MAEGNFGIMDLLQKLFKERGKGVSKEEQGVMGATTSKAEYDYYKDKGGDGGYQSFIDKSKMKAGDNYTAGQMQYIDPLANTTAYNNATTNALNTMKGYVPDSGVVRTAQEEANFQTGMIPGGNSMQESWGGEAFKTGSGQESMIPFNGVSNVDTMFAQALGTLTPAEQSEIISATRGYNDAQVENFKIQYLQGRISPYELEAQSNLGF